MHLQIWAMFEHVMWYVKEIVYHWFSLGGYIGKVVKTTVTSSIQDTFKEFYENFPMIIYMVVNDISFLNIIYIHSVIF